MADDVSAGRLHLDAIADTSGFARDAQRKIDAEVKAVRARIKAELDTRGLITQARAAAKAAQEAATVRVKAELDSRGLISQARTAAAAASKAAKVKIQAEIDEAKFKASLAASVAALNNKYSVSVNVDADVAAAEARIAAFKAGQKSMPINLGVNVNTGNLGQVISQMSMMPAIAGGVFLLVGAVGQLAGGLFAVASAASQAVVGVAALPNLLGAVGQGLAVLLVGVSGVGDGIAALTKSDQQGATQAAQGAKIRVNSSRAIAQAQDALKDAYHQVADAAKAAMYAVRDARYSAKEAAEQQDLAEQALADTQIARRRALREAEWNVQEAAEGSRSAQEALSDARENAADAIDDYQKSLARMALDEAGASNAVDKARQHLQDVQWDPSAGQYDVRDATLAVAQAEQDLADAREKSSDAARDAHQSGVDQSDVEQTDAVKDAVEQVSDAQHAAMLAAEARADAEKDGAASTKAAQEALRDANHAVALSVRALAQAEHDRKDQKVQGERQIAAAQDAVKQATESQTQALGAQSLAQKDTLDDFNKLSPAAQKFALFLYNDVIPRLKDVRTAIQGALLPPLQTGITKAMPLIDTLQTGLVGTAGVVGRLAIKVGELFGSKGFNQDTASIMDSNNRVLGLLGRSGLNLIKVLSDLAAVAGPTLAEPFARWILKVTQGWQESVKLSRETGALADRFDSARERAGQLAHIIGQVAGAIYGMGKAATPAGVDLLDSLDKTVTRWNQWANSDAGQKRMQEYFKATKPTLREIGKLVGQLAQFVILSGEAGGGPLTGFLTTLLIIFKGLNAVLNTPYLGAAVGWLLTLAGVGGAIGLVSGQILKLASGMQLLAKVTGLTKLWNLFTHSLMMTRIQVALLTAQQKLAAAASKVWAVAMRGLGIAMKLAMGPWGLALLAVIGIFVLLYNKVGWFRAGVQAVMKGVVAAFGWLVDGAKWLWDVLFGHSVFPDILDGLQGFLAGVKKVFTALGNAFMWLWNNGIKPAFGYIQQAISLVWTYYYKPMLQAWWFAIKTLGAVFGWLWSNAIKPAMSLIQGAISLVWTYYWKPLLTAWWFAITTLGNVVMWLWDKAIKPSFNLIMGIIDLVWTYYWKPMITAWWTAIQTLGTVVMWLWDKVISPYFGFIKDRIVDVWGVVKVGLKAFATILGAIGDAATTLWKKAISPYFTNIRSAISTAWTAISPWLSAFKTALGDVASKVGDLWTKVQNVFTNIKEKISTVWQGSDGKSGVKGILTDLKTMVETTLVTAFETGVTGITKAWDGLKKAARTPVEFVVEKIYNEGIRKVVNAIPGVPNLGEVHLPKESKRTGGVLSGYTPGRDVHRFTSPTGGQLDLSGGEAIMRPEWTRQIGPRAVDAMNAAARRGGDALRSLLGGGAQRMNYWMGGVLPLPGASSILQHSGYSSDIYAGDLNWPGRTDYGKPIVAYKGGTAHQFDYGRDYSYGRGVMVSQDDGNFSLYAHMSAIANGINNAMVRAGQTIGFVGDYGNTGTPPTSHLHYELKAGSGWALPFVGDGGTINAGVGATGSGSTDTGGGGGILGAIKAVKNAASDLPEALKKVGTMGDWGTMMKDSMKSVGGQFRDWVNDKVPGPGPLPDIFDKGGTLAHGQSGINLSGKDETVFTNENIVDTVGGLARISNALRGLTADRAGGAGAPAPLVGSVSLTAGNTSDAYDLFDELEHRLRLINMGGVYASDVA